MRIPKELSEALGFQMYRTGLLLRKHLIRSLKNWGLTPEQWQTLATLTYYNKPLTQQELCEITLLDKHALSKMLDRMASSGWVKRIQDPKDGRSKLVLSTEKAKQEIPLIIKTLRENFDPLWERVPMEDQNHLRKICKEITEILNEA